MRGVRDGEQPQRLIVDDNDDDALLVAYAFGEAGFDLRWSHVDTASALVDALRRERWDVVLCDCRMPQLTMPAALLLVRGLAPLTPVVLVSGNPPEEIEEVLATNVVEAGAAQGSARGPARARLRAAGPRPRRSF
jgi:CheY-like chemotaxis protein